VAAVLANLAHTAWKQQHTEDGSIALLSCPHHRCCPTGVLCVQALTPCELFQRIRGRTLWFAGDSQTWHFFYSAECFLRNFAPSLHRT
jgi:hypothetical protein